MTEQEFINHKMPILIRENYSKAQAYMISKSLYKKEHAQQGQFSGDRYGIPQGIDYTFNPQMPAPQNPFENTGYANYSQTLEQNNPMPQLEDYSFYKPQRDFSQYNTLDPNFKPSNVLKSNVQETATKQDKTQYNNEVNIFNPFTGVSLDDSLMYAGQGFGEGDPWKAGVGTSLSLLKGARGFMSGYANGKESRRVARANEDKLYEQNRNYIYQQQGGSPRLTNAENLTGQFIGDNPQGNVNAENGEYLQKYGSMPQEIVGEKHVVNGKEHHGTDVVAEEGDKFLSNTKILPIGAKNAKELKDRYNISVKPKDTFAAVQKKIDTKIGYKKETEELASWIEKFGDNEKIKDKTTKELNAPIIEEKMIASKAKIEALNGVRGMVFEDLYARQEMLPKKGKPGDLFTDSGKLVTEKNEGVAQQGGEQQDQAMQIIQMYAQASGQDPQALAEQISQMQPEEQQQALQQMAQELQSGEEQGEQNQSTEEEQEEMQQGGLIEMANKYGISPQRAQELISLQQGGKKDYYQSAGEYTPKQQKERLDDYYNHISGLGYTGTKDIGKMQNWMAENHPQEVTDYFTKNEQPLTAKHIDLLKENYKSSFKRTGIDSNKNSADYTTEEKLKLQKDIEGRLSNDKPLYKDFLLSGFKDNKWDWRFPMVGTNLQAKGVTSMPKTQISALSTPTGTTSPTEDIVQPQAEEQVQKQEQAPNGAKTYMPSFPVDLRMPPSALQALNKPYVPFERQGYLKGQTESIQAANASALQTQMEALNQTGLPPQQIAAMTGQYLASTQGANSAAIGAQNKEDSARQFQVDQFNIGQRTKEDMANAQFSQKYQDQMLGSMAATERDWRNYFTEGNLQNRMNYNDIENANLLNAKNEQYAVVPGQGVIFKNNQSQDLGIQSITDDEWNNMTAQQQFEYTKNKVLADRKKNYLT